MESETKRAGCEESYLVQGSETINVGCVNVCSLADEFEDLLLVPGSAG